MYLFKITMKIFNLYLVMNVWSGDPVEVREQLCGISSRPPACRFQELTSSCQAFVAKAFKYRVTVPLPALKSKTF